jgi:hypothetical protein
MRVRVTVHSIPRPTRGTSQPERPRLHRDFNVTAANIDAAREQARELIERDGLEVRSMSVCTDGSIRCIACR